MLKLKEEKRKNKEINIIDSIGTNDLDDDWWFKMSESLKKYFIDYFFKKWWYCR